MAKLVVLLLLSTLAAACSDPLVVRIGDVRLTVATTGADLDPDGYTIALDGAASLAVAVNDTKMFSALATGTHSLLLNGLATNCTVAGANPRDIEVGSHETTQVSFAIACTALPPLNIAGVWDWTEQYVNSVCHDTGTYVFAQTGATFAGRSDQVGTCDTPYGPWDNTSANDPVSNGVVSGSTITFFVGANGQCSYTATVTGTPPDHLSGTTICGNSTGIWEAVRGQPVASVTVTPARDTLLDGATVQLGVQLWSPVGHRVFRQPVTWSSDKPDVAAVSDAGNVTAIAAGSARITANADGKSGAATIVVVAKGHLRVTTATSGVDPDPDGYAVLITAPFWWEGAIGSNGTVVDSWMPGTWTVQLTRVAVNCSVTGPNPRTVTVLAGDTATTHFDVLCAPVTRLAFATTRDGGNAEIYSVNSNGTNATRLTVDAGTDGEPAWSPDGGKVAFHSDRDGNWEIYVMNTDGSALTRLTTNAAADYSADWSPDGTKIAFTSTRDGNAEIYVMSADGSDAVRLTTDPAIDQDPAWSPDGSRIAFTSYRNGTTAIYVMNADGSGLTRLTDGPVDLQPAWSPDGANIAFTSGDCFYYECTFDVYVVNADGSGRTRLTAGAGSFPNEPAWSPDGRKLAFRNGGTTCDYDYGCWDYSSLQVMNANGTDVVGLMTDTYDFDPAWRR